MDLFTLNTRIFSIPINTTEKTMIYCLSHHISLIEHIVTGLKRYGISSVYILKNLTCMSGVDSYAQISKKYKDFGINVELIPFYEEYINTKNESDAVIKYALDHKINDIILCAPTFHILRATLTMISSAIDKSVNIQFAAIINETPNWNTQCITHQGLTHEFYKKIVELELDRIHEYTRKGDIRPFQHIMAYLNKFLLDS